VNRIPALALLLAVGVLLGAVAAPARAQQRRYWYVAPTVGVQLWDESTAEGFHLDSRPGFLWGARAGFTPTPALSIELVGLTGTNDLVENATGATVPMRMSQLEGSFLINFQSLLSERVYPFLCLGVGVMIRRAGEDVSTGDAEDSHVAFHLGGGIRAELRPGWALRFTGKDSFFGQTQGTGNEERQVTVDTVELSLALEARFQWGR
jgi:hypothetical protein